jgi:hypothetical protein
LKTAVLIIVCLLIFQNVGHVGALGAEGLEVKRSDLPRAFLPKDGGNVIVRKEGNSISLSSSRAVLEEILQKIAEETKVTLNFYCNDPSLMRARAANIKISADSLVKVLQQLLSEDHRFTLLNREG